MSTTQAPRAVGLVGGPVAPAGLDEMAAGAVDLAAHRPLDLAQVLAWTGTVAADVPHPGSGRTRERWEWLATLGAVDLTLARVAEPHLDAVSILAEAGVSGSAGGVDPAATWGVWAAEGPDAGLTAVHGPGGWRLSGTKPWCSLAGAVSHALVTAWRDDGRRGLYAVDLGAPGIGVDAAGWQPHGLAEITTATVTMDDVPAREVGSAGWYLTRPGFAWGGIGVAAVWFGGAVGLARRMRSQAERREPDQVAQMHLGAVDAALSAAGAVLATTADAVDSSLTSTEAGVPPAQLAARARQVVADAAEQVMARTAHALGPGPLAHEAEHGRRVADLGLYLRQHHGERDQAALGRLSLDGSSW